ncbi:MAG: hypothetical protein PW788_09210 [Micavibrio sp.]|nr:hypothetical protein [Micavibrio sp.]
MTTARQLSSNDERFSIGQWFDSVSALVEKFPTRIGTQTSKTIRYDRSIFQPLTEGFNAAAQNAAPQLPKPEERAVAATHVYRLSPATRWDAADEHALEAAAEGKPANDDVDAMLQKMTRLQKLCALHRIGIAVHAPQPGVIQINLVEQARPKRALKIAAPKIKFGRGF